MSLKLIDVQSGPQGVVFDLEINDVSEIHPVHLAWITRWIHYEKHYWYPEYMSDECGASETYAGGISITVPK